MMKKYVIGCVGLALSFVASSNSVNAAEIPDSTPQVVVRYGDLNLSRTEDVNQLYRRLTKAAEHVCGNLDGKTLERRSLFAHCTHEVMDDAITRIPLPG
jgi:UrcA family protein